MDDYTTTSDADGTRHSNNASYIGRFGWEYGSRRHRLSLEFQGGDTKNARGGDMGYYEHRMQGTNVINDAFYDSLTATPTRSSSRSCWPITLSG